MPRCHSRPHLKAAQLPGVPAAPAPAIGDSIGKLALAFCVGGGLSLLALHRVRQARTPTVDGPADGAPLMRAPLQAVAPVDLKRYAGLWHEQARLPNRFQPQGSSAVTAEYSLQADGTVQVRNRCTRANGQIEEAMGTARVVPVAGQPGAGRLEVRFAPEWLGWLPMVWADYWILKLDRDYQVALVGTPNREYLWVLSREEKLDEAALQVELEYARTLGFDVDRVVRTPADAPVHVAEAPPRQQPDAAAVPSN